jgi:class 3 adenylate cyclase
MAVFDFEISPDKILFCCLEIFNIFNELKMYNKGKFKIKSKASIDFGNCYNGSILESTSFDPIGRSVDRCARISKEAEPNSIVISDVYYDILKDKCPNFDTRKLIKSKKDMKGLGKVIYYKLVSK